jgi:hypothetical protein
MLTLKFKKEFQGKTKKNRLPGIKRRKSAPADDLKNADAPGALPRRFWSPGCDSAVYLNRDFW